MKPKRPSSAMQRSQTFRISDEKPNNHHLGLLTLAKPVVMHRPQTAKMQQGNPCLIDTKPLLSEKDINQKLHECLKADMEMAQAQLNFHLTAEKMKAQEQKKLLMENYEDSKKLIKDLTSEKIDFLKRQHRQSTEALTSQHQKSLDDLTQFFEKRLENSKEKILSLEKERKNDLEERSKEIERKVNEFNEEKKVMKRDFEQLLLRRVTEEIEKKEEEMETREKEIRKDFEKKIRELFENLHGEYEDQLSENEIRIAKLNETIKEKERIIDGLWERLKEEERVREELKEELKRKMEIEIELNQIKKKTFEEASIQTDLIENPTSINEIDCIERDLKSGKQSKEDPTCIKRIKSKDYADQGVNTESLEFIERDIEEALEKLQKIIKRKNQALEIKDSYIEELQNKLKGCLETHVPVSEIQKALL